MLRHLYVSFSRKINNDDLFPVQFFLSFFLCAMFKAAIHISESTLSEKLSTYMQMHNVIVRMIFDK